MFLKLFSWILGRKDVIFIFQVVSQGNPDLEQILQSTNYLRSYLPGSPSDELSFHLAPTKRKKSKITLHTGSALIKKPP